jgi:hypothetical protein
VQWLVVRRPEGGFEARGVRASAAPSPIKTVSASAVWIDIAPGRSADVEVTTLLLPEWSAPIEARLRVEVTQ